LRAPLIVRVDPNLAYVEETRDQRLQNFAIKENTKRLAASTVSIRQALIASLVKISQATRTGT